MAIRQHFCDGSLTVGRLEMFPKGHAGGGIVLFDQLDLDLNFVPDPDCVVSGARELEIPVAERLRKGKVLHEMIV